MDPDEVKDQFFAIADNMISEQANDYLDVSLQRMEEWIQFRQSQGLPADLRSFIGQVMHEPNMKGPVVVAMCAAMWRLRELKEAGQ